MFIFLMRARAIVESFESRPRCRSASCYGWDHFRAAEEAPRRASRRAPGRSFRPADGSVARARRRCRSSLPCLFTSPRRSTAWATASPVACARLRSMRASATTPPSRLLRALLAWTIDRM